MAEAVKVIVRCRPMNSREKNLGCEEVVSMTSQTQCTIVNPDAPGDPPKDFTFDGAYFTESTTEQIYNDVCFDLVENVLEGYNGTVFAYGQTGCGKSFSMQGIPDPVTQRGIIPRAFDHIFEAVAIAKNKRFLVYASYLEIYNEQVRDLLSKDAKKQLDLKEHPEKGVYVHGLSMNEVRNVEECQLLMAKGWNNRSVGATLMNADSSRSHSIFTINIEIMDEAVGAGGDTGEHFVASKLNLVDLAGSERQSKTGASGDRLKEATKINLSLSALGNVISALVDGKSKHIPYRDSKLTRLLQDSLGGNTKTLMVACLSPAADNYDETLSTLRYANRAKNIKNKPKINEDPKDALLRQYQEEITQLKAMLQGNPLPMPQPAKRSPEHSSDRSEVEKEKEEIKREYEAHLRRMEQQMSDLSRAKEMVEHELSTLKLKSNQKQGNSNRQNAKGQPKRDENHVVDVNELENIVDEIPAEVRGNKTNDNSYENEDQEDNDEELFNEFDEDFGEEEGGEDGNYLTVNERGDASAFKKSPELRRKNARPKSSAPSLISITETEAEVSPRQSKRSNAGGNRGGAGSSCNNSQQNNQTSASRERVTESGVEEQQPPNSLLGGEGSDPRGDPTDNCDKIQSNYENGVEEEGKENNNKRMQHQQQQPLTAEQEAAMKRLAELEAMFSKKFIKGGDQTALSVSSSIDGLQGISRNASGSEQQSEGLQEKRLKRKKQQEEKRRKALREAADSENMDTVVQVYDNVMSEIQDRQLKEERLKRKLQAAEVEIRDLTSEFEDERRDYLETIRSQTKQMQLVEAILEKVQPLIQRDCNYFNMRKVKEDSKYDIDGQCWRLPDVQLIKTNLPSLGQDGANGSKSSPTNSGPFNTKMQRGNTMTQSTLIRADHQLEQSSHGMKLLDESGAQDDLFQNYMKPKRAQKILEQGAATRNLHDGTNSNSNLQYHNGGNGQTRFSGHHFSQQQQQPSQGSGAEHPFNPGTLRNPHQLLDQSFSSPTSGTAATGVGVGSQNVASPNSQFEIPNPKNVRLEKLDLNAERPFSKTKKKKKEKTFFS